MYNNVMIRESLLVVEGVSMHMGVDVALGRKFREDVVPRRMASDECFRDSTAACCVRERVINTHCASCVCERVINTHCASCVRERVTNTHAYI